jgi:hypothetical protein
MPETAVAERTAPKELLVHSWKPGQSGNPAGRPKGARHKLGEAFIEALHDDFQTEGVEAIRKVRAEKPDQYLKVIASIIPQEVNHKVDDLNDGLTDAELFAEYLRLRRRMESRLAEAEAAGSAGVIEGEAREVQDGPVLPARGDPPA